MLNILGSHRLLVVPTLIVVRFVVSPSSMVTFYSSLAKLLGFTGCITSIATGLCTLYALQLLPSLLAIRVKVPHECIAPARELATRE